MRGLLTWQPLQPGHVVKLRCMQVRVPWKGREDVVLKMGSRVWFDGIRLGCTSALSVSATCSANLKPHVWRLGAAIPACAHGVLCWL